MKSRISATEAARSFSELMNRACYRGESFVVERGGVVGERDLMIGATAIARNYVVATRDERSFSKIPGLSVDLL